MKPIFITRLLVMCLLLTGAIHVAAKPASAPEAYQLAKQYELSHPDSNLYYLGQTIALAGAGTQIQADAWKDMGNHYNFKGLNDSAAYCYDQAMHIYEQLHYAPGIANIINNRGILEANVSHHLKAVTLYKQALEMRLKIGQLQHIASTCNNLGNTYLAMNNIAEALHYHQATLQVRYFMNDSAGIATSIGNIGTLYYSARQYSKALKYYQTGLRMQQQLQHQEGIMRGLLNTGGAFAALKQYDSAAVYFEKLNQLCDSLQYYTYLTSGLNNLAEARALQKRIPEALALYQQSLKLSSEIGDSVIIASSILGLAQNGYYGNQKLPQLLEAYRIAETMQESRLVAQLCEVLAQTYEAAGQNGSAFIYLKKLTAINDQSILPEVYQQLADLQTNYEVSQKEAQISLLRKEKELQVQKTRLQQFYTGGALGFTLLCGALIGLLWYTLRRQQKSNQTIRQQAEELEAHHAVKDKIFSVLSHDMKAPIISFTHTLELMDQNILTADEFEFIRGKTLEQTRMLKQELDNLLQWATLRFQQQQNDAMDTWSLQDLTQQAIRLLGPQAEEKNIQLSCNIPPSHMVQGNDQQLCSVIRNITANAIKFSPPGGTISIYSERDGKHTLLCIADQGAGMTTEQFQQSSSGKRIKSTPGTHNEKGTGMGLMISKLLAEQNGATLTLRQTSGTGTTIQVSFPEPTAK